MKIIHCADLHIDSKLNANLTGAKRKERKAELLNTFCRMVDYANESGVDAIIIAGDMFDTKSISVTARNTVYSAIKNNSGITFFYLKGNHDVDGFLNDIESIPDNLKLFDDGWKKYNIGKRVVVTGAQACDDNMCNLLVLNNDSINIVVLHGQDAMYQIKDKEDIVNLSLLMNKGIDYLALGHIHTYRCDKLDQRGVYCYPGCLEPRGFDECGEHGFVLLDIDEDAGTISNSFVPFCKRKLYEIEVDISGCNKTPEIAEQISRSISYSEATALDMVKLVLTGEVDVECEKDIDVLVSRFESDFYFLKIYDETRLAVDYNEFRHDESLKGEFVRTVMGDDSLDEDTKAKVIRCGIMALAGEESI